MSDLSDDELNHICAIGNHVTADQATGFWLSMAVAEIRRNRAMLRRIEAVCAQLEQRTQDSASVMWGEILRAAITGRQYLYRCPEHGDRKAVPWRRELGVTCGESMPLPWKRPGGSACSKIAVLVGEVDAP